MEVGNISSCGHKYIAVRGSEFTSPGNSKRKNEQYLTGSHVVFSTDFYSEGTKSGGYLSIASWFNHSFAGWYVSSVRFPTCHFWDHTVSVKQAA